MEIFRKQASCLKLKKGVLLKRVKSLKQSCSLESYTEISPPKFYTVYAIYGKLTIQLHSFQLQTLYAWNRQRNVGKFSKKYIITNAYMLEMCNSENVELFLNDIVRKFRFQLLGTHLMTPPIFYTTLSSLIKYHLCRNKGKKRTLNFIILISP